MIKCTERECKKDLHQHEIKKCVYCGQSPLCAQCDDIHYDVHIKMRNLAWDIEKNNRAHES